MGRAYLVTGASSGIGRAVALKLNERGYCVVINGRNGKKLQETKDMAVSPANMFIAARDLAFEMDGLADWLNNLRKEYGPLHGMVCSAGITWNAPTSFYSLGRVAQIFDICCHAPLILNGVFCKSSINAGPGSSIVNIAAAAAIDPNPGQGVYAGAKAALIAASKCMAKEVCNKGIRINCVSPGLVETPMMEETCRQLGQAFIEKEKKLYPLGLGKPEYIANIVAFLLSEEAAWITGQNFVVSGGR